MNCKHCKEFLAIKNGLCIGCFEYLHGRTRREINKALGTANLFLLLDIDNNFGISFLELRKYYASDGSLASHISNLEKKNLIKVKKEFIGKKPRTTYYLTEKGKDMLSKTKETLFHSNVNL